jgi:hypothetical protein
VGDGINIDCGVEALCKESNHVSCDVVGGGYIGEMGEDKFISALYFIGCTEVGSCFE